MNIATITRAIELARRDGEFALLSANVQAALVIVCDQAVWRVDISAGTVNGPMVVDVEAINPSDTQIVISADADSWAKLLSVDMPAPFHNLFAATSNPNVHIAPEIEDAPRYNMVRRFGELLRHAQNGTDHQPTTLLNRSRHGKHDAASGRYIHLDLHNVDHRVYYEHAGEGVPLFCQHTAGADARQWRHLLEDPRVTDRFQVIAYDLPYHGRSLPPESVAWWAEEYTLTIERAMEVPVALAAALGLDRPVFMGSSVGGLLALDLARYHSAEFRAVIALEASLRASVALTDESAAKSALDRGRLRLADPARHAAEMIRVMSPLSPESFRHETMFHYAQGAPGVYTGDIHYHAVDHDLRNEARHIDTERCPVYLLTGEYDFSVVPGTKVAGSQIPNASVQIMDGLGHFPMSENYDQLMNYVLPILDEIAAQ